ncbi:MAG: phosphotransferase [Desulfobulbales bacterium]|nr:phosphotransferase [Desulfobulbales bacterium]
MSNQDKNNYSREIRKFLLCEGFVENSDEATLTPVSSDGSSRLFFKIKTKEGTSFCGVLPGNEHTKQGIAEAHAAFTIGSHLKKRGISVPEIYGFKPQSGLILFEDLGDTLLYDRLENNKKKQGSKFWQQAIETYKEVIELLLFMQISGSVRFDRKWCWDTQRYNKKLMLEKESGYFMQAFCRELLGINRFTPALDDEFKLLAGRASRQPAVYFLHRDFQSRNLMFSDGEIRVIDFQGGRLGPLGYDLASLLLDPYVQIPAEIQQELLDYYLEHLCKYGLDDLAFLKGYPSLALQRNLQILGAFAFLAKQRQKDFFAQFILPATHSLQQQLAGPAGKDYPHLRKLTENILGLLGK